ncbi:VWA domain-containing protein [Hahella sp. SMD15-11]|uniref:VWA domain-containing protein n=1 Tax=Thermohahella caldifontis TaxID=3142973 RepID=A0AB39UXN7_9GAMM
MEEWVGQKWHHFITRKADHSHPEAEVRLADISKRLHTLLRALTGNEVLDIQPSPETWFYVRQTSTQKLAGLGRHYTPVWRSHHRLYVPEKVAFLPDARLNESLYLWWALLASQMPPDWQNWLVDNQTATLRTLQAYPGIRTTWHNLTQAVIRERPDPDALPADEAAQERAILQALLDPGSVSALPPARFAPVPVHLWLYPQFAEQTAAARDASEDEPGHRQPSEENQPQANAQRKRAERTDAGKKDGLLLFRLESLLSWAEMTKVDRSQDDSEEDDSAVADDLDVITLSKKGTASKGLKLSLDLPAEAEDDIPLDEGLRLPEWDFKRQAYRQDYCRVLTLTPRHLGDEHLPEHLQKDAQKVRRHFQELRPVRYWQKRLREGDEIDLGAWLDFQTARQHGHADGEPAVFSSFSGQLRDLNCLVLADLSLSTDAWLGNRCTVLDVIRDSLLLFSEALTASGDTFALYGFSSRRNNHVRITELKSFTETYNDAVRARINGLKPGYYTRMGAAIRRATQLLSKRPAHQKLLLLITDGKPNDLDQYEGRYGAEDTRMAVREARMQGVVPFCVTIDKEVGDYLPWLFGSQHYCLISNPHQLPARLPDSTRN